MHISEQRLKSQKLTYKELEHIGSCEFCALRFSNICAEDYLPLPLPVKEEIKKKAKLHSPEFKKKKEFRRYCLQIGLSCAGAIALIATTKALKPNYRKEIYNENSIPVIIRANQTKESIIEFFTLKEDDYNEKKK